MINTSRLIASIAGLLAMLALTGATRAESRQFGDYDAHYSVFASSFLQPAVASAYGIVRANDRAVLNIALRQRSLDKAVAARVTGTRGDLIYKHPLEFREVREDGAIYYLADFPFLNDETLYFEVDIGPEEDSGTLKLRFEKVLYVD
jgi:hypothetical protein